MNAKEQEIADSNQQCPVCDHVGVITEMINTVIRYGVENQVEIPLTVPVRKCVWCNQEFLDHVGESIQEEAIQNYLKSK